jgi:hypothetical protein
VPFGCCRSHFPSRMLLQAEWIICGAGSELPVQMPYKRLSLRRSLQVKILRLSCLELESHVLGAIQKAERVIIVHPALVNGNLGINMNSSVARVLVLSVMLPYFYSYHCGARYRDIYLRYSKFHWPGDGTECSGDCVSALTICRLCTARQCGISTRTMYVAQRRTAQRDTTSTYNSMFSLHSSHEY